MRKILLGLHLTTSVFALNAHVENRIEYMHEKKIQRRLEKEYQEYLKTFREPSSEEKTEIEVEKEPDV